MKTIIKSLFLILILSVILLPLSIEATFYNNREVEDNSSHNQRNSIEKNHSRYDEAAMNEMIMEQEVLEKEINEKWKEISHKKIEVFNTQDIDELIRLLDHLKAESIAITEMYKKQNELNKQFEAQRINDYESTSIKEQTCVYGKTLGIFSIEDLIKNNKIEQVKIKQMINQSIIANSEEEILAGEDARDTLKEHEDRLLIKAREMERLIREIKETCNYKID